MNKLTNPLAIKDAVLAFDLEHGFAWAELNGDNIFQVCLNARKDGNGFKQEIDKSDCGHDFGLCRDHNTDVWGCETLDDALIEFIRLARASGFKIK
jgi:hypothetical protein